MPASSGAAATGSASRRGKLVDILKAGGQSRDSVDCKAVMNVSETVVERLENCRKRYDVQRRCVMDDSDWHLALDVRLLQGRKFKAQTLIVTDRVMAITGAGDAQEQLQLQDQHFDDMIPLCEIRGVQSLSEPFRAEGSWHHNRAMIAIHTKQEGANSGRKYLFQAQSARFLDHRANLQIVSRTWSNMEELETLVDVLQDLVKKAIEAESEKDKSWLMLFERSREAMRALFESNGLQMFIAFLIVANFAVNAFEAQMTGKLENDDGSPGNTAKVLEKIDIAFTVVFTIELAGNLYAHLFWDFVTDGWCLFDFVIVAVSLLNPLMPEGQGSMIKLFRLLRAFRVLRIFGRVGSIRSIVNALIKSLVPVLNAFFIMFIVLALYAIIGVTIFGESAPDDFGNLSLGIISLFRIAAGETWIESVDVADEEGNVNWGTGGFVMSYILIINWTLLQVGMAVLLDTFVSETSREQEEAFKKLLSARRIRDTMGNVLDPFLRMVTSEYIDAAHLKTMLGELFEMIIHDKKKISVMRAFISPTFSCFRKWRAAVKEKNAPKGLLQQSFRGSFKTALSRTPAHSPCEGNSGETLNCHEICEAICLMHVEPRMHFTELDYAVITENGALADAHGNIGKAEFVDIMTRQVNGYIMRRLQRKVQECNEDFPEIAASKMVSCEVDALSAKVDDLRCGLDDVRSCLHALLHQDKQQASLGHNSGGDHSDSRMANGVLGHWERCASSCADVEAKPQPSRCDSTRPAAAAGLRSQLERKLGARACAPPGEAANAEEDALASAMLHARTETLLGKYKGDTDGVQVEVETEAASDSIVDQLLGMTAMLRKHQECEMEQLSLLLQKQPELLNGRDLTCVEASLAGGVARDQDEDRDRDADADADEAEVAEDEHRSETPTLLLTHDVDPQTPLNLPYTWKATPSLSRFTQASDTDLDAAQERGAIKHRDYPVSMDKGVASPALPPSSMSNGFWGGDMPQPATALPFIDDWRVALDSAAIGYLGLGGPGRLSSSVVHRPQVAESGGGSSSKIEPKALTTPEHAGAQQVGKGFGEAGLAYDPDKKVWIQLVRPSPEAPRGRDMKPHPNLARFET